MCDGFFYVFFDTFYHFVAAVLCILVADFGSDGEAGRHGHAEKVHFSEVGTFAAKEVAHACVAFCVAVAECIDSFH